MRTAVAAALALIFLAVPDARPAPGEPELVPLSPTRPPPRPRREATPPRATRTARPPAPPQRDESRESIRRGPPERAFLTIRSRLWLARSSVNTRYSIQIPREYISPPAEVFYGETEERAVEGILLLHSVELAPIRWFSGEFEYGTDRHSGRYTDRYWLHSPHSETLTKTSNGAVWHRPDHEDDTVFTADHAARREWISASVYFRLAEGRVTGSDEVEVRHAFDLSLGGHRFRQASRYTNRERTLSTGKFFTQMPLGPIAGFDATYTAAWTGPHLGLREDISVPLGFSFEGQVLWSPLMEYRADGYDNQDTGLRATSPNYTDRASGSAVHFRLGAAWNYSVLRVEAGYMRFAFTSAHGNRRYYVVDGSVFDQPVETTRTEISGLYAGANLRF